MQLNGGLGDVDSGSRTDLSIGQNAQWTEKVTSVKGDECNTFWVISLVNNHYYPEEPAGAMPASRHSNLPDCSVLIKNMSFLFSYILLLNKNPFLYYFF